MAKTTLENQDETSLEDWLKVDDLFKHYFKRYALLGVLIASVVTSFILGPMAQWGMIIIGCVGTFALYPDIEPEGILMGGTVGLFAVGHPLGFLGGSFLAYQLSKQFQHVSQFFGPLLEKINELTNSISAVKTAPQTIGSALKSAWKMSLEGIRGFFGTTMPEEVQGIHNTVTPVENKVPVTNPLLIPAQRKSKQISKLIARKSDLKENVQNQSTSSPIPATQESSVTLVFSSCAKETKRYPQRIRPLKSVNITPSKTEQHSKQKVRAH